MHRRPLLVALALSLAAPALAQAPARGAQYHAALATADGVRATLYRYVPPGGLTGRTILLLTDVGATRRELDFSGHGLAPYLQQAGIEVYVVEYRGAGRSEVPYGGYRLEDLLDGDAESGLTRALLGRERVAVGGVGLGATFALALAARHPERVSAVVALQPLVDPDLPAEPVLRALAAFEAEPAPWIDLASLTRTTMLGDRSWFEVLFANDGSIRAEEHAALRQHVLAPLPRDAARQLAQAARERSLALGGRPIKDLVRGFAGPTLLVFAPRDNAIHPEFSVPVRDLLPRPPRVVVLDRLANLRHDYGHLGMLLGDAAPADVFAPIAAFLHEVAP